MMMTPGVRTLTRSTAPHSEPPQVTDDNVDMCRVAPEYVLYSKEMMQEVIDRAAAAAA